jgi:hypothetical protein
LGIHGDVLGVKKLYALSRASRRQTHHATAAAPPGLMTPEGSRWVEKRRGNQDLESSLFSPN